MSDYPMLISNKLHSFRNFVLQISGPHSQSDTTNALFSRQRYFHRQTPGKESEQSTDYLKSNIINVLYSKLPLLPRYKIKRLVNFTTNYLHKSNFHTTFAFAIRRRSLIE